MMETDEFVVGVNDADFGDFSAADLIMGQCYEVLAREDRWLRIIDESGEDVSVQTPPPNPLPQGEGEFSNRLFPEFHRQIVGAPNPQGEGEFSNRLFRNTPPPCGGGPGWGVNGYFVSTINGESASNGVMGTPGMLK